VSLIAAIWLGARLMHFARQIDPPGDESGAIDPGAVNPPVAEAGIPPEMGEPSPSLNGLRALLYANGYRLVNCQMHNGVLVLWGSVPHEIDRVVIQALVIGSVGLVPMNDQLHVQEATDTGP